MRWPLPSNIAILKNRARNARPFHSIEIPFFVIFNSWIVIEGFFVESKATVGLWDYDRLTKWLFASVLSDINEGYLVQSVDGCIELILKVFGCGWTVLQFWWINVTGGLHFGSELYLDWLIFWGEEYSGDMLGQQIVEIDGFRNW